MAAHPLRIPRYIKSMDVYIMTVRELGKSKWQSRFKLTINGKEIRRQQTFPTESEAETWKTDERYKLSHPAQTASRVLFADFSQNFIDLYKSKGPPRIFALYQNTVNKIKEQFGDRLLTSITRDELHYQLGIKRIGMHGMRHTHATRLFYAGYSDWYIAKRFGHNSLKELHRTYGHVFKKMQAEADTKLRASIGQDYLGKTATKVAKINPK